MDLYGSAVGAGNAVRSDASSAAAWPNRRRHSITLLGAFPVSAATVQTVEKPSGGELLKRSSSAFGGAEDAGSATSRPNARRVQPLRADPDRPGARGHRPAF